MKLDRSALPAIAQRVQESRRVLDRTQRRISESLDGLFTVHEAVAKATHILRSSRFSTSD